MVSKTSIIFMFITMAITLLLPVILTIIVAKKHKKVLLAVASGILSFFVLQVLIRIPLLQLTSKIKIETDLAIFIYLFFMAFSAALFETVGRYIFIKLLLKQDFRYETGLAHGIGHGGIEAIVLIGMSYINYLIFAFIINSGNLGTVTDALPEAAAQEILLLRDTLINTNSYLFLVAGVERVFTIFIHIALSVLMMYGFKTKKYYYFLIVLAIHFLVDFSVGVISTYIGTIVFAEILMMIFAGLAIVIIFGFKNKFTENQDENRVDLI